MARRWWEVREPPTSDGTARRWWEVRELYRLLDDRTPNPSIINLLVIGGDPSGIGGPSDFGLFEGGGQGEGGLSTGYSGALSVTGFGTLP